VSRDVRYYTAVRASQSVTTRSKPYIVQTSDCYTQGRYSILPRIDDARPCPGSLPVGFDAPVHQSMVLTVTSQLVTPRGECDETTRLQGTRFGGRGAWIGIV
jgi:hypothetical protein